MQTRIFSSKDELGTAAAADAAEHLRQAIASRGEAHLIVATGASQFDTLAHLVAADVDWSVVTAFHLDEYVGMSDQHPASFRKYLRERFHEHLPNLRAFHYVQGDADDPRAECRRLHELIAQHPIDVALIGIGENGHIAFNDPPADMQTDDAYIVVELDEACRKQQFGEGWFDSIDEVPKTAISMSVRQIMKPKTLIVSVPDERKAQAVRDCLTAPVSPEYPCAILREHDDCTLYMDEPAAKLLDEVNK